MQDPNINRNTMGSRAGTSIKPKFGAGGNAPAPSRQGTAARVQFYLFRDSILWELAQQWMSRTVL